MKKHLFMLLALLSLGTAAWSQMKIDVPYFVELFNQGKFAQLYNEACSLRAKKEFGKMAILDFFIAKSLCATGSYATAGKAFRYILTEYPLTPKQKFYIEDEYGNCKNAQLAASLKKDFHYANFKLVSTP